MANQSELNNGSKALIENEPKSPIKLLLIIFPILILSVIEHGIALPVLPAAGEFFDATPTEVGILFSIQYLGQFIISPLWGWLSDRFGRKNVLLVTLITGAAAEILTALSPSLTVLYIGRLFVGLTAGNIAIASALLSDMTTEKDRSKGMAIVGISYGLGFVLGAPLGGILAQAGGHEMTGMFQLGLPFFAAAISLVISAILTVFIVPTPDKYAEVTAWNNQVSELRTQKLAEQRRLNKENVKKRDLYPLVTATLMCLLYLGYTISVSIVETRLSPFLEKQYDLDHVTIGMTFGGVGLVMLLVQGSLGRLSNYISDFALVAVGGLVAGVGYIIASYSDTYEFFFALLCVVSIGRGFFFPGILAKTSKCYDSPKQTGKIMGFFNSSGALGRIAGPLIGGILAEKYMAHTPFLVAGICVTLLVTLWIVLWVLFARMRTKFIETPETSS